MMNILQQMAGLFGIGSVVNRPQIGASVSGGLDAGAYGRRLSSFVPSNSHINTLIAASGQTVNARARYLARNNGYVAAAVESFAGNAVGVGIKPASLIKDPVLKEAIQEAWLRWTDESDAEVHSDFYGQMRRAARELFIAGEVFIRFRPRRLSDGLSVPLQLQMLPSEQLSSTLSQPTGNGNVIRQGIEFDVLGQRVAYWFWRNHPGDITERCSGGSVPTRVPASEVLHIFDGVEAGQVRGLSKLAPVVAKLWLLDLYDDAELDRKKVAAMYAGFITRPDTDTGAIIGEGGPDANGVATAGLQPGTMQVLLPGEDIKFSSPADVGGSYEAFQYRTLMQICAGMGVPYQNVTGDMSRANYASSRSSLLEFRRRVEAIQHSVFVFQLCRPVWERWITTAVLSGALDLPGFASNPFPYLSVRWTPPKWDWVDPLKDIKAEQMAVESGFKARSDVIESLGEDAEAVDARIAS
ncbi:MAG: phage portal protein, partial [Rhodospirillaceae bacterium]